jgi:hypothetical protein
MRDKFRTAFFAILTRRKSVKIISCVTNVKQAYQMPYVKDEEDLYFYTYKPVSEPDRKRYRNKSLACPESLIRAFRG